MNGALVPLGGTTRKHEQWDEWQRQQRRAQRSSVGDIPAGRRNHSVSSNTTVRGPVDYLQPAASPPPARSRRSTDVEAPVHPAAISAYYLRSSDDYHERQRRVPSAEQYHSLSPVQSNRHREVGSLSGSFNAPTHVELERHKGHRKRAKGMHKLRSVVKAWIKA
ncbi:uncharacterized protein K460DRAFT_409499 [Cucurbitaria berberidis CBS 394.84]|uniref:Uncharacterized protein n=1 Tax=Cucurbitaria berberidis CBS 394.84 TaxID=1168544 RepID=A0A9P4GA96_9PLEO|nr:uncharacterized protein K460DRAFT_409499 [Cucurbitaria berberidis CBS 394.84]KAF1842068.1 hypothetical protein K460DRAFT_409499 [Cucurbitaria berberidis CBS 394.84]